MSAGLESDAFTSGGTGGRESMKALGKAFMRAMKMAS